MHLNYDLFFWQKRQKKNLILFAGFRRHGYQFCILYFKWCEKSHIAITII